MPSNVSDRWLSEFRKDMRRFEAFQEGGGLSLSVKVRVSSGCFCPSCCPAGHRHLNDYLAKHPLDPRSQKYFEHETGPEFLIYLGGATVAIAFTTAIVNLVTAVIKARSEGAKKSDKPAEPMTVIIRGIGPDDEFFEHEVITVETSDPPITQVKDALTEAIDLIAAERCTPAANAPPKGKRRGKE